jgi:hypothetical protein
MTVDRIVHSVAGVVVLLSIGLARFVHPDWIWLGLFVGLNLLQSGFTGFCPLAGLLKRIGVREGGCCP